MIVDSSALIAIILSEPEASALSDRLASADRVSLSAISLLEALIVAQSRRGQPGVSQLWQILNDVAALVEPFTPDDADHAFDVYKRYGKGHHPAGLNLGDVCAYALAKSRSEPLLFKGNDFAQTDIAVA